MKPYIITVTTSGYSVDTYKAKQPALCMDVYACANTAEYGLKVYAIRVHVLERVALIWCELSLVVRGRVVLGTCCPDSLSCFNVDWQCLSDMRDIYRR